MSKVARAVGLLVAIVGAAIALSACGTASTPTRAPTATPDGPLTAEGILDRAREAAAKVTSVRYVMDREELSRVEPEGWTDDDPKWDRMEAEFTSEADRAVFHLAGGHTAESVTIDYRQFNRVDDAPWRETVMRRPFEGMPDRQVLSIPRFTGVTLVGETEIDGVGVYHISGELPRPDGDTEFPAMTQAIDVYIARDDFLLLRVDRLTSWRISNENGSGQVADRSVTTYRDFNVPITIERPTDIKDVPIPATMLGFSAASHLITFDTDRTLSEGEWADLIDALESHLTDLGGEGIEVKQDGSRGLTITTEAKAGTVGIVYDRVRERAAELGIELTLIGVTRQ